MSDKKSNESIDLKEVDLKEIKHQIKLRTAYVGTRRNHLRDELLIRIGSTIEDLEKLKEDVQEGFYGGLGGSAQNMWSLYVSIGKLYAYNQSYDEINEALDTVLDKKG